jgi:AmmeMemoRadiSam system radical SAM enzyme
VENILKCRRATILRLGQTTSSVQPSRLKDILEEIWAELRLGSAMPSQSNKDKPIEGYAGRYWHRVENDAIHCDLCPRACVMKEGDRGFCFVRKHEDGIMKLTTYGKSTGFCIDPIEKKPLNHFLPGTSVLSFGTAGCNLGCQFCQNWSISKSREIEILSESAGPEDIAEAAHRLGCRSVAFTYNDPVIWAEYAIDTAKACKQLGLKTVAVTAGYITPEARPEFYSVMDAANVDLKAFSEQFYKRITLSALQPVLDTLEWLKKESDVWFEITNLMIPGENDSPDETAAMCDWIVNHVGDEVPVHFTAFHPDFRMVDKPPTPAATLTRARQQAIKAGIKYAYVGNVHDEGGQTTYCPSCRTPVIARDWYEIHAYNMKGNACKRCGTVIPGLFESKPGKWGRFRQPVDLSRAKNS